MALPPNRRPINFRRGPYIPSSAMVDRPLGAGGYRQQATAMPQAVQSLPQPYAPQAAAAAAAAPVQAQAQLQPQTPLQAQAQPLQTQQAPAQPSVSFDQSNLRGGIGQLPQAPVPQTAMPAPMPPMPPMPQPIPPMPPAFDQQQLQSSLSTAPAPAPLNTGLSNNPYMANLGSFQGATAEQVQPPAFNQQQLQASTAATSPGMLNTGLSSNPYMANLGSFPGVGSVQPPALNQQQLQSALSTAPAPGMLNTGLSSNPYMANLGSFPGLGSVQPPALSPLPTTAQGKADYYNNLARQGMSDSQIRSQAESAFGQQSDEDWGYLQNLAGVKTGPDATANLAQAPQAQNTQAPAFDQATLRNNLGGVGTGQPLQQPTSVAPPTNVGTFAQPMQATAAAQAQPAQTNFAQPAQNKPAGSVGLM